MIVGTAFEQHGDRMRLPPWYKSDAQRATELLRQFEWAVDLIHDMVLELTRAANLICDRIRRELDPLYRIEQGLLIVDRPGAGLHSERFRPRYARDDLATLYQGLDIFIDDRADRDVQFGSGRHTGGLTAVVPFTLGDYADTKAETAPSSSGLE